MASVADKHPEYRIMEDLWRLPEDLMGGTKSMRQAGKDYLPVEGQGVTDPKTGEAKWVGELYESWDRRVYRTTLYNAYKQAIYSLRGRVFSSEVTVENKEVFNDSFLKNIDLLGRNLTSFCIDAFSQGLIYGKCHFLPEMPRLPQQATAADAQFIGARPYLCLIHPRSVFNWRHESLLTGEQRLTQVRIKEKYHVDDGEWGTKTKERIRVLSPGKVEFYELSEDKNNTEWYLTETIPVSLNEVPLITCYFDFQGAMVSYPPLEDLAEMNRQHWYSTSLQNTYLAAARQSILFLSGSDGQSAPLQVGPNKVISSTNTGAKLSMVETSGVPMEHGWKDLQNLEDQMAKLAMEPLLKSKPGSMSATEYTLQTSIGTSQLRAWATVFKDAIELAFAHMHKMMDSTVPMESAGTKVNINVSASIDANDEEEKNAKERRGRGDRSLEGNPLLNLV